MLVCLSFWFAMYVAISAVQKSLANLWKQPVALFLLALAFVMCAAIDFGWWSDFDPLTWLNIFGIMTKLLIGEV